MTALAALGWTPVLAQAFRDLGASGLIPARLAVEHRRGYDALCEMKGGLRPVAAVLPGRLRRDLAAQGESLAVGDWVALRPADKGLHPIAALLPRRSAFVRKTAGDRAVRQIVAANLDKIFIAMAVSEDFNPRRLERYLTACANADVAPILLLTKADLADDLDVRLTAVRAVAPELPCVPLSLISGAGIAEVRALIGPGESLALVGSSGVGKSSLANALLGEAKLSVGATSDQGKGRHTTTRRELLPLPGGGVLIDTPGMREFHLWEAEVSEGFPDIETLATDCRFRDCRHQSEPECAVRAAVTLGALDPARLAAFHKLREEQDQAEKLRRERGSKS
ncbi:putative ribosome biogenesis GTPase RsgA [Elstera cyanobacteriorum]|nr:ribosome small subunit-dependent GTPase A [Elstera cyanobacteriorum]GFZ99583.1 putative ribosome biogenesis GTPase RsgA [Elstera cyanobacteriorum]